MRTDAAAVQEEGRRDGRRESPQSGSECLPLSAKVGILSIPMLQSRREDRKWRFLAGLVAAYGGCFHLP